MSGDYNNGTGGHSFRNDCYGTSVRAGNSRGSRQRSKVLKALKGIASLALIDEVMREDARKRREKEREGMMPC